MAIDYDLRCDVCGRIIDGSSVSPAAVRRQAKRQGVAFRYKGRDYCKLCFDEFSATPSALEGSS